MKIHDNLNLKDFNSYKINAICKKAIFPENETDLIKIFKETPIDDLVIIGGGYNIILSKPFYDQTFIIMGETFAQTSVEQDIVIGESGVSMKFLSELALTHSLTGLEIFYDIPSSLGGAVVMNAGASGEEIKDILVKVRYLDLDDMKVKEILKEEINFEYRNSFFQKNKNKIVLKTWLKLRKSDPIQIKEKMERTKEARWLKQPREFPNGGSVFKRPKGFYVGTMIDELGLKGLTIGGAQVSQKHGGFIINHSEATGNDILQLIDQIKINVREKFGIDLEIEQRVI
ncbi:UDP-N-acetylmuramate dehydrogenase [Echinicola sp. CAU 1574]|uniref:UDP-N-acetylenolpyruvoylglucosamine reductase n=1 Tax=Echinicola arenosa TaxID=2774144 RepID=A0ABR9AS68_9BACT|nr:UDP-N-acetylmuramate dehydrogenase [Echinicola arenosa]MBD8490474.1 UDP-N-acetylmuramate dehydrogenase [Echinicola arenosa]